MTLLTLAHAAPLYFEGRKEAAKKRLQKLKEAGLVLDRQDGTRRLYRARPEGLAELRAFLEQFWGDRLEALKREAEREESDRHGSHD